MLKNRKGMGLVEALVAIFIISVALIAILEGYRQSVNISIMTRNYNNATYLAQQVLEELKKNDNKEASEGFDAATSITSPQIINGVEYTIMQSDPSYLDDLTVKVTVEIFWTEGTHNKSEEFSNLYYFRE